MLPLRKFSYENANVVAGVLPPELVEVAVVVLLTVVVVITEEVVDVTEPVVAEAVVDVADAGADEDEDADDDDDVVVIVVVVFTVLLFSGSLSTMSMAAVLMEVAEAAEAAEAAAALLLPLVLAVGAAMGPVLAFPLLGAEPAGGESFSLSLVACTSLKFAVVNLPVDVMSRTDVLEADPLAVFGIAYTGVLSDSCWYALVILPSRICCKNSTIHINIYSVAGVL